MRDDEDASSTIVAVPRIIVSYDVTRSRGGKSSMVYQHVYGRKVMKKTAVSRKIYRYRGLVEKPSVEVLGQSVLMMKESDAEDFHAFLWTRRVSHTMTKVWIEP